ncbi:DUF2530 domain-containing protein [Umezawaea beigongshangensis]|uniref:DUF2530 domain-containing protein n=1 Tax=Umezawaea beigongshangensis TaxID=2780383 RepID=UPI0027DBCF7E|nr:DUF2530 domain-containing protein [Umezawaea beigongshangensis]
MAEPSEIDPLPSPPPLPPRLADPVPAIVGGTALWGLALVVLLVARLAFDADTTTWVWASLCGFALGIIGHGLFRWQRGAARRGSRTAQTGL